MGEPPPALEGSSKLAQLTLPGIAQAPAQSVTFSLIHCRPERKLELLGKMSICFHSDGNKQPWPTESLVFY